MLTKIIVSETNKMKKLKDEFVNLCETLNLNGYIDFYYEIMSYGSSETYAKERALLIAFFLEINKIYYKVLGIKDIKISR